MNIEILNKEDFIKKYNVPTDEEIDMFPLTDWYLGYGLGCFLLFKMFDDIELEQEYVLTTDTIPTDKNIIEEIKKQYKIENKKVIRILDNMEV